MLRTAADLVVIHQERLGSVVSLRTMPRPPAMMIGHQKFCPHGTQKLNWTHPDNSVQKQAETRAVPPTGMTLVSPLPWSETVAPVQKHSVPVSTKPQMPETKHEEGQPFEKRVQKVCSNRELRPVEVCISSSLFNFCFFSSSWKRNSTSNSWRTELLVL